MHISEHISLKELTTLKIGGVARYLASVSEVSELREALHFAEERKLPVIILGGGSNVLIANGEINSLVIKIDIKGIEWKEGAPPTLPTLKRGEGKGGAEDFVNVIASAGESWDGLVVEAVRRGLWGIENLSGIPGTVGATPIQNIGAYGVEIKDLIEWVEVFDTKVGIVRRLSNVECGFAYRDSIFKHPEGKGFIVLRVALRLKKGGIPNLAYRDLKEIFNSQFSILNEREKEERQSRLTPQDVRKAVLDIRSKKFPDLGKFGTAGSFFKNPIISKERFDELKKRFPNLPGFPLTRFDLTSGERSNLVKVPLAWILDNVCNLRGYERGNVKLFEKQPIVLVQNGLASSEEIESFAKEIATRVKEKTGIDIEWEVQKVKSMN
ncbi:MAG: UDP-N-acetylenolpyruvoylglucosamine reductase [Candidatus Taylorbacteria bacterium RIFCSPHIGHO2_01_FULL_51_15]|uniref:UDP-N-acetylenolpyruvoylglucosamine reductase n=1 Tax=Candidatus Taylorbacteria bacterium RIFCSPHIGHO2_01_FULL_51_15 TaxID=1802304 RepID=A0A1G2M919_9BACT|nr:MAG: UDP-N-acetylenolpyruvoylglucosamine reductase [Candidatus Taylorbacteria bacterium RIFCSPHIGHO2_01_FULL_51_15]